MKPKASGLYFSLRFVWGIADPAALARRSGGLTLLAVHRESLAMLSGLLSSAAVFVRVRTGYGDGLFAVLAVVLNNRVPH